MKMEGMSPEQMMIHLKNIIVENFRTVQEAVAEAEKWRGRYEELREKMDGRLLNGVEAARILGRSPAAITAYRKAGKIKSKKVGNTFMYRESEILKLKEKWI